MAAKRTIFISYSRADARWLERLRIALAPLTSAHELDPWDDQRIQPGAEWRKAIENALAAANAAVLLVTPAFFASAFITKKELPAIRRRQRGGLPLVWIPVSATNFDRTALRGAQAAHDPSRPLDTLRVPRRNQAFVDIVEKISAAAATSGVGDVLQTTDAVTPAIMSSATGEAPPGALGIVTVKRAGRVEFHTKEGRLVDVIDPPDLSRLSEAERGLITTYQESMASAYVRWQRLYPRRDALTRSQQASFRRARRQMCDDLGDVIDFLDTVGKHPPDHYRSVRFECERLQRSRRSPART